MPNWLNHSSKTHADAHKTRSMVRRWKFETSTLTDALPLGPVARLRAPVWRLARSKRPSDAVRSGGPGFRPGSSPTTTPERFRERCGVQPIARAPPRGKQRSFPWRSVDPHALGISLSEFLLGLMRHSVQAVTKPMVPGQSPSVDRPGPTGEERDRINPTKPPPELQATD